MPSRQICGVLVDKNIFILGDSEVCCVSSRFFPRVTVKHRLQIVYCKYFRGWELFMPRGSTTAICKSSSFSILRWVYLDNELHGKFSCTVKVLQGFPSSKQSSTEACIYIYHLQFKIKWRVRFTCIIRNNFDLQLNRNALCRKKTLLLYP